MSHIKKFSYQDTSKRWLIPVAVFLTYFILIIQLTDIILSFKNLLPYFPVASVVLFMAVISFFIGNISGRFFYTLIHKSIIINILFALLLSAVASFYFLKTPLLGDLFGNLSIYIHNRLLISLFIILPSFFGGVLNSYFLNISTGDFLDEKNLLSAYLTSIFLAVSAVLLFTSDYFFHFRNFKIYTPYYSVLSLILLVTMFFINKKFNPEPLFAKHYIDEEVSEPEEQVQRDDLFYTYMNFTYIITYIFLGHLVLIKFFGNVYYHGQLYLSVVFIAMSAGYFAGKLKKPSFWYVYSEMLFPVIFLTYLFLLYYFNGSITIRTAYIIAAAPAVVFGFSLRQTFENILSKYDHDRRFNIINFSLYILPIPVILSISFIQYSNLLFYVILYIISILNIIIPGIFLFNLKINPVKKIAYFVFSLIFIPVVLLLHLYFKIPLNLKPFYTHCENYELLLKTNFNLPYITENGEITIYGAPAFYLSDSNIRNLKRAAAASVLYTSENSNSLIIDGNQKFFSNPVFSLYPDSYCIDTLPAKHVDYNRLPISGNMTYTPVERELLNFLLKNRKSYDLILDSPNLLDQTMHPFRFSARFYNLVKNNMSPNGVYSIIFDMKYAGDDILKTSLTALNEKFKFHTVYLFSDILLVVSSDNQESLKINANSLKRIEPFYSENTTAGKIFFSSIHPLNNILYTELDSLLSILAENQRYLTDNRQMLLPQKLQDYYFSYNPVWFKTLLNSSDQRFYSDTASDVIKNAKVLSILKQLEYAEAMNEYEKETLNLFELKKYSPYSDAIRRYVENQLSYKEKYYQSEALRYEKNKKWNEAATLYKAILSINPVNFDANYKLGLLYITLQDIESAFVYLDKALKLQKDNPQALYQMGILMFFNDKFKEAIDYLEQANKLNVSTPLLYMYLGMSYEKTGRTEDAKKNYEKAIQEDPNDNKLKLLLDNLNVKINTLPSTEQEGPKTNMIDDEKDENITIPVNKKAINARLKDDE